jgi:hypothetical protein
VVLSAIVCVTCVNLSPQIFHDMALAVSQLHDCGVVHRGIDGGYFKVAFAASTSLLSNTLYVNCFVRCCEHIGIVRYF